MASQEAQEWDEVRAAFKITHALDTQTRDRLLTEYHRTQPLDVQVGQLASDVAHDLRVLFADWESVTVEKVLHIVTAGNRGIILGTVLTIVVLALLAMRE